MCDVDTDTGTFHISHWFDGLAHSHKFEIVAGGDRVRVVYTSRRQAESLEKEIAKKGKMAGISFGQKSDPCMGLFAKAMGVWNPSRTDPRNLCVTINPDMPIPADTDPTTTTGKDRSLIQATDSAWFGHVDPSTLEITQVDRQSSLHRDLKGPLSASHGQRDATTGDYFNVNLEFGRTPKYRAFQVEAGGATKILATITSAPPAYFHSFFLTENYLVLYVPATTYGKGGISISMERNVLDAIEPFDKSRHCHWYVVDRRNNQGVVAEFRSRAAFFFHSVNAFEEDGHIFCDLVEYPTTDTVFSMYYDVLLNRHGSTSNFWAKGSRMTDAMARLVRYALPTRQTPKSTSWLSGWANAAGYPSPEEVLSIPAPHIGELPTINPSYHCRKHRFVYSLPSRGLSTLFDTIAKTDTVTRDLVMWNGPAGHTPGEPIFVARPGRDLDEDDGVLLSVVLDGANKISYLLCLDAKTMTELGRAECEFAVSFGFHGSHM